MLVTLASRISFVASFKTILVIQHWQMKKSKLPLFVLTPLTFGACFNTSNGAQNFRRDGKHNAVNFAHFVNNPSHRLNGAVLVIFMVWSPAQCAYQCINNQDCYSFNFAAISLDGRHSCELLNTDRFLNSDDLVCHAGFDHFNIKVSVFFVLSQ